MFPVNVRTCAVNKCHTKRVLMPYPLRSMYGIFTYIYHNNQPNVGKYTIYGSHGLHFTLQLWLLTKKHLCKSPRPDSDGNEGRPVSGQTSWRVMSSWFANILAFSMVPKSGEPTSWGRLVVEVPWFTVVSLPKIPGGGWLGQFLNHQYHDF